MKKSSLILAVVASLIGGSSWAASGQGADPSGVNAAAVVAALKAKAAKDDSPVGHAVYMPAAPAAQARCATETYVPDVTRGGWKVADYSCHNPKSLLSLACTGFCCCGCANDGYDHCSAGPSTCSCW